MGIHGGIMKFILTCIVLFFSSLSLAQVTEFNSNLTETSAGTVIYTFTITDGAGTAVSDGDLNLTHEKKLHFIAYDESLTQFQHVHPEYNGTSWTVELNFKVNGNYRLWIQGQTSQGKNDFSLSRRLQIKNGEAVIPAPTALGDVRSGVSGETFIELSANTLKAGKMAMLDLTINETGSKPLELEPYLGAFAHVIAVPLSGDQLLHVHPMEGGEPNVGMLHTEFPAAGDYRLWVQVQNHGEVVTVPLSVRVK
jgi:hypothetical protein